MASFVLVALTGCGDAASDNGQVVNTVELPTGPLTSLYCPDIGVGDENCVLYDPANPYARSAINGANKFELADAVPSPLSAFYLWATAHARDAQGENQFYTADSLHRIFVQEGSTLAQDQAIRAYRAVLDDFFGSVTFDANQNSFLLRNFVGDRLITPSGGLTQLFADRAAAVQALDGWGYVYDTNTTTLTRKTN